MKYIFVLLVALAMALPCHGQDLPDYTAKKNEFNLGYFDLFNLMGTNSLGIGYKRVGSMGAFRVGTGFGISSLSDYGDTREYITNKFSINPRVGYEFHLWLKRFRVHYGAELAAGYSKYETVTDQPENNYYLSNSTTTKSIAIRPLLGISFFIHPSISIATETNLNIAWNNSENTRDYNSDVQSSTNAQLNTSLSPLGIVSINFHF
jgi:Outer membrane protein beta-barrel domain